MARGKDAYMCCILCAPTLTKFTMLHVTNYNGLGEQFYEFTFCGENGDMNEEKCIFAIRIQHQQTEHPNQDNNFLLNTEETRHYEPHCKKNLFY